MIARPRPLERAAGRSGALGGRRGRNALAAPQHLRPWPRSMLHEAHAPKAGRRPAAGAAHLGRGCAQDRGGLQLQRRPARSLGVERLRLRGSAWLSAAGGGEQRRAPGSVRAGQVRRRTAPRGECASSLLIDVSAARVRAAAGPSIAQCALCARQASAPSGEPPTTLDRR